MEFSEPTLHEESIFAGRVICVKRLTVQLQNGRTSTREVVHHRGAVAVLAEPEPGRVLLVEQYRKACEQALLEIPAGKLEHEEQPDVAAKRELREETGFSGGNWQKINTFYTSPGFSNEKIYLYYATNLTAGDVDLDEDEFVESRLASRGNVLHLLQSGAVQDAKTLVALYWWLNQAQ